MKNKIVVEGVMCGKKRPEIRFYPSGDKYLRFYIIFNGKINKKRVSSLFSVVLYNKMAEAFDHLNQWEKGQKVKVAGQLYSWQAQFGNRTDIACKKLEIIPKEATAVVAEEPKTQEAIVQ